MNPWLNQGKSDTAKRSLEQEHRRFFAPFMPWLDRLSEGIFMAAAAETLRQETPERQKSFDPMASVRMLRWDIENFGQVLPETRQQVCNE